MKVEQNNIVEAVDRFTAETYKNNGSYSYACGYLSSMLKEAIASLPKKKRLEMVNQLTFEANWFEEQTKMKEKNA